MENAPDDDTGPESRTLASLKKKKEALASLRRDHFMKIKALERDMAALGKGLGRETIRTFGEQAEAAQAVMPSIVVPAGGEGYWCARRTGSRIGTAVPLVRDDGGVVSRHPGRSVSGGPGPSGGAHLRFSCRRPPRRHRA